MSDLHETCILTSLFKTVLFHLRAHITLQVAANTICTTILHNSMLDMSYAEAT